MSEETKTYTETELIKISLKPGEVLGVKIISDEVDESHVTSLRKGLKSLFPNNEVMVFCLPVGSDMEFVPLQAPAAGCGPSVCVDCNCGKKENL